VTCLLSDVGPAAWPLQVSWPHSLCRRDARSSRCDGRHTARPADWRCLPAQAVSGNVGKFIVAGQAHALGGLCCARRHTRTVAAQGEPACVGRPAFTHAPSLRRANRRALGGQLIRQRIGLPVPNLSRLHKCSEQAVRNKSGSSKGPRRTGAGTGATPSRDLRFDQVVMWSSRPGGLHALQREVHPRLHAMVIEAADFPLRMD